jgi:hypothetical protein
MNSAINKFKHWIIKNKIIFLSGTLLIIILIALTSRLAESDDTSFLIQIQPYNNFIDWVIFRYQNWSGRIFAESLVYIFTSINLIYWKIITIIMYVLSVTFMYLIYRLWDDNPARQNKLFIISIITVMPLLMGFETLFYGTFWVTGGMAYFWMTTLALMAIYPVVYYLKHGNLPKWYFIVVSIFSTIVASSSQEQIGASLLALNVFVFAYLIHKKYKYHKQLKIPYFLIFYILLVLVSLFISVMAPGNKLRYNAEIATWLPDFLQVPILSHLQYGYRWFLEGFINNTGVILALIWGSVSLLLYKMKNISRLNYILCIVFMLASVLLLSKGHDATKFIFNFNATWNYIPSKFSYISLIPWSMMILLSVLAPFIIYANSIRAWLLSLLTALSVASALVMTISPTMYASGWRTIYVSSYLLLTVLIFLLSDVFSKYKKYSIYIYLVIIMFALAQFINTFYNMYNFYN